MKQTGTLTAAFGRQYEVRTDGGETLLALINRADSRQTLDLSGLTPAGAVKEVLFGAPHNDLRALKLAPLSAALLRLG